MRRSLRVFPTVVLGFMSFFAVSSTLVSQTTGGTPSVSLPGTQSPFQGSSPEGTATSEVLQIDFKEAIDRGLRNNLGLLLAGDQTQAARGQRWQQLAELLPNISIRGEEDVQTTSLTALGLRGNVLHTAVPRVIGPFNYFDLRANATQTVFDYRTLEKER
jgi:outer membrane protein TolC